MNRSSRSFMKSPRSRKSFEEFGGGKKGVMICPKCNARYYKKAWHHTFAGFKSFEKDVPVKFKLCPADEMMKNHQYEGRIVLKNVPVKIARDLEHLIRGFTEKAYARDPMDRLIDITKGAAWEVTLTENQLAEKLARKISSAYHIKVKMHFAGDPSDVVEITGEFPPRD